MRPLLAAAALLAALAAAPLASAVRDMAKWLRSHKRVELAAYYSGRAGSVWDLASKPASRAAYRALITPLG
jgi:hypothetical protein